MAVQTVAVIGAGIAGLSLANFLTRHAIDVLLVDRAAAPGGRAAGYGCKATERCLHCGLCLLRNARDELKRSERVRTFFATWLRTLRRSGEGRFALELESLTPFRIDWRRCSGCGRCLKLCPDGAVAKAAGWSHTVEAGCTGCGKCLEICPQGAIAEAGRRLVSADCIVVATGFAPFDPAVNRRWGYPAGPRVVTGSELESLFFQERFFPDLPEFAAGGEAEGPAVAFIQCVGSRNLGDGQAGCSRVCCAYALRLAGRLKHELPRMQADFYVMDIQNFGRYFAALWPELAPELNFIHTLPVTVLSDGAGKPVVRFELASGTGCREKRYDLLVLSQGVCPAPDAGETAALFALDVDERGFFGAGGEGIFTVGSCTGPRGIEECVEDALSAGEQVRDFLGRKG